MKVPFWPATASAILLAITLASPVLASDDDGEPDSHSWEVNLAESFGRTIFIHSWDTLTFQNGGSEELNAIFLVGDGQQPNASGSAEPTRPLGTYWDAVDLLSTGAIAPGESYWITPLEVGVFEYRNQFNPEQTGLLVVVPELDQIPVEGHPLDAAAVAADPIATELIGALQ